MEGGKILIGYWHIRGLGRHIVLVAEYVGANYEVKDYYLSPAPEYSREVWLSEKFNLGLDFPNLPYLVHGDLKLTETRAIIRYIASKHQPEILGKTLEDQAKVDMLDGCLNGFKHTATMMCYS